MVGVWREGGFSHREVCYAPHLTDRDSKAGTGKAEGLEEELGTNLPMSLSPRLVLTAQEHLQPFSFRESGGRYCEYNVHREDVFSCHPCVWCTAMVWGE